MIRTTSTPTPRTRRPCIWHRRAGATAVQAPDLADAIVRAKGLHRSVKALTLFHKRDGAPLAYTTIYGHWRRACEKAEVKDAHFHDIRAATATDARAAGMDSRTLLGHTTESSHNRYLRSKIVPVAQPVPARRVRKS